MYLPPTSPIPPAYPWLARMCYCTPPRTEVQPWHSAAFDHHKLMARPLSIPDQTERMPGVRPKVSGEVWGCDCQPVSVPL